MTIVCSQTTVVFRILVCVVATAAVVKAVVSSEVPVGINAESLDGQMRKYCIVGAGAGGIQLGQFMLDHGRDYVLLEKAAVAGSFYRKFPVHRKLISINKRFTGRTDAEFNLRHDWNSLLNGTVEPMTSRTAERFPHADILAEYLDDFARVQVDAGRLALNVHVESVTKHVSGGFDLVLAPASLHHHKVRNQQGNDADNGIHAGERAEVKGKVGGPNAAPRSKLRCQVVIMAHGLSNAVLPPRLVGPDGAPLPGPDGRPLIMLYEDLEADGRIFENRTVVIFGMGNAAFETADAATPYAQYIHMFPWTGAERKRPLSSWESRYVGDVRATNSQFFDSYLLKSIDGGLASEAAIGEKFDVVPCGEGRRKRCLLESVSADYYDDLDNNAPKGGPWVPVPPYDQENEQDAAFISSLNPKAGPIGGDFDWNAMSDQPDGVDNDMRSPKQHVAAIDVPFKDMLFTFEMRGHGSLPGFVHRKSINDSNIDEWVEFTRRQGPAGELVYDDIVVALGWQHDNSIYGRASAPLLQPNRKFPVTDDSYQSVNVDDLYFAGVLAHGKDYKRSAGGFIHGFRYTARALFRLLSERYDGEPWPVAESFDVTPRKGRAGRYEGIDRLVSRIFNRIDKSDGNYQMVHVLGDGMVLRCQNAILGRGGGEGGSRVDEGGDGRLHDGGRVLIDYYDEVPLSWFHRQHAQSARFVWNFGYSKQQQDLIDSLNHGTMFQAMIWYYGSGIVDTSTAPKKKSRQGGVAYHPKELLKLFETLHTRWATPTVKRVAKAWLSQKISGFLEYCDELARGSPHPSPRDLSLEWRRRRDIEHDEIAKITKQSQWGVGVIDVWVQNLAGTDLLLDCGRINHPACTEAGSEVFQQRPGGVAKSFLRFPTGGKGAKISVNDGDVLSMRCPHTGEAIGSQFIVDISRGIVQNWIFRKGGSGGYRLSHSSSSGDEILQAERSEDGTAKHQRRRRRRRKTSSNGINRGHQHTEL